MGVNKCVLGQRFKNNYLEIIYLPYNVLIPYNSDNKVWDVPKKLLQAETKRKIVKIHGGPRYSWKKRTKKIIVIFLYNLILHIIIMLINV